MRAVSWAEMGKMVRVADIESVIELKKARKRPEKGQFQQNSVPDVRKKAQKALLERNNGTDVR